MASLLLPKWSNDLKYSPCPPARDWLFFVFFVLEVNPLTPYFPVRTCVTLSMALSSVFHCLFVKLTAFLKVTVVKWMLCRCVRQERISKRIYLSVHNACAKTAFLDLFWPRWDPVLDRMMNKRVLRASFTTLSILLSVHLFLHVCHVFSAKVNLQRDTVRTHRY